MFIFHVIKWAYLLFEKVKYFFTILTVFLVGAVFIIGPSKIREEMPYHVEIGIGIIAFGCLMIVALYSVRAKAFLISLCMGVVAAAASSYAAMADDAGIWQRVLFGALGLGAALFAVFSLVLTVRGEDPSGEDIDRRAAD